MKRIVIIGSGMGGGTIAAALAPAGHQILMLERGERLERRVENRDDDAIFAREYFKPDETWRDAANIPFRPGNYYNVGGNSKFYGAVLTRYRQEDFGVLSHLDGESPAWPIRYDDLEPWYQQAEEMYQVRGQLGEDPTEPAHSGTYLHPALHHEDDIADVSTALKQAGAKPYSLPLGVDIDAWLAEGQTPWDAFPNAGSGKKDAESIGVALAERHANFTLQTGFLAERLVLSAQSGQLIAVEGTGKNGFERIEADIFILSAGAVNSAALLLRSASEAMPNGLANKSDAVGRYFMNHNCTALLALHPFKANRSIYQKTLGVNDYYLTGGPDNKPLGNIQLLGKISPTILKAAAPALPQFMASWIARHSVDWYVMSEDLPHPDSRVTIANDNSICLDWRRSNETAHHLLVEKTRTLLKKAGYPIIMHRPFDRRTPSHQCGTTRMGIDPEKSVVDIWCRSHDHDNLYIVDAGFLPCSAAVNPALTIAAQALRVADHLNKKVLLS